MLLRYLPRFQDADRSIQTLASREAWARDEIEAWQLERINQVWASAIEQVPYYRALAGLPKQFRSLAEYQSTVPVLSKRTVAKNPNSILAAKPQAGGWKRTGGSTGTPMRAYWSHSAHREMLRCEYRYYQHWNVDYLDRVAWLWGHGASFAPGLVGWLDQLRRPLQDWLRNRLRLSAYKLGRDELRRYLDQLARFEPRAIFGYSQAVALLAKTAAEEGFQLPSLNLLTLTGEPATPQTLAFVGNAFNASAATIYGSVECGALAQQWPDGTLRVREDHIFLETVPRDDGYQEILVTVLNNPSFPLLRYAIGDVSEQPIERPEKGFAILHNVVGRASDFVIARSGRYVHPARFEALFHYEFGGIERSLVHQLASGEIKISLVPRGSSQEIDVAPIQATVAGLVEGYPVTVEIVESIPCRQSGKHRLVISDLLAEKRLAESPREVLLT